MLEHTGRKSAKRRVVLEVVADHEEAVYVAAGWRSKAVAEMVTKEEALELMNEYARANPRILDRLAEFMLDDPADTPEEQAP